MNVDPAMPEKCGSIEEQSGFWGETLGDQKLNAGSRRAAIAEAKLPLELMGRGG